MKTFIVLLKSMIFFCGLHFLVGPNQTAADQTEATLKAWNRL